MGKGSAVNAYTDLVFDISAASLPACYPFALWDAISAQVPELQHDERVGVLPLRGAPSGDRLLLSRRSKLVLRVPVELAEVSSRLAGAELAIDGERVALGAARLRAITHYPTLHAQLAVGCCDEAEFVASVQRHFAENHIDAQIICGMRSALISGTRSLSGYSLVLHDLKPEASVLLQCIGIGEGRKFGCGIFIPYKVITDLE